MTPTSSQPVPAWDSLRSAARRLEEQGQLEQAVILYGRASAWDDMALLLTELERHAQAGNTWLRFLPAVPVAASSLSPLEIDAVRRASAAYQKAHLFDAAASLLINLGDTQGAIDVLEAAGMKADVELVRSGSPLPDNPWPTGKLSNLSPPGAREDNDPTNELRPPAAPQHARSDPGVLAAKRAHVERAIEALMGVAMDDPHFLDACDQVAKLAWEHGLMSVRVAMFLEPLLTEPLELRMEDADTLYTLGRLYERIGLHEKASIAYAHALALQPKHRAASMRSARLKNPQIDPIQAVEDAFSNTIENSEPSQADRQSLEEAVSHSTFEFNLGPIEPGSTVADRFVILQALGEGGCGVVFKAHDQRRDDDIALKVLRAGSSEHRAVKRFQREMEISAKLSHPNIVKTWDSGVWRNLHWIAMEVLDGLDLGGLIRRIGRPLPVGPSTTLIQQALWGLSYAHSVGVVHRDIKPSNIFVLRGTHNVKVLDFGLALAVDKSRFTRTGTTVGSPRYMAPERLRGGNETGPWTDLYSIGVVLYRMLTATMPFKNTDLAPLLEEVATVDPPPASALNPAIPPELDAIVARLLAKRPDERYRDAREVLKDLEPFAPDPPKP